MTEGPALLCPAPRAPPNEEDEPWEPPSKQRPWRRFAARARQQKCCCCKPEADAPVDNMKAREAGATRGHSRAVPGPIENPIEPTENPIEPQAARPLSCCPREQTRIETVSMRSRVGCAWNETLIESIENAIETPIDHIQLCAGRALWLAFRPPT